MGYSEARRRAAARRLAAARSAGTDVDEDRMADDGGTTEPATIPQGTYIPWEQPDPNELPATIRQMSAWYAINYVCTCGLMMARAVEVNPQEVGVRIQAHVDLTCDNCNTTLQTRIPFGGTIQAPLRVTLERATELPAAKT